MSSFFKKLSNIFFEPTTNEETVEQTYIPIETTPETVETETVDKPMYFLNTILQDKKIYIYDKNDDIIDTIPLQVSLQETDNDIYLVLSYNKKQLSQVIKTHPDYANLPLENIVFNGESIKPKPNGPLETSENYISYDLYNDVYIFQDTNTTPIPTPIDIDYIETDSNRITFVLEKDDLIAYGNNVLSDHFKRSINARVTGITIKETTIHLNTRVMPYTNESALVTVIANDNQYNYDYDVIIPRKIKTFTQTGTFTLSPNFEDLRLDLPDGFTITTDDYANDRLTLTVDLTKNQTATLLMNYLKATGQTNETHLVIQYLLGITDKEPNGIFNQHGLETDQGLVSLTTPLEELI